MITPDIVSMNEGVTGIQYDTSTNALIINYSNGTSNQIILTDNFLSNAIYLNDENKAHFIMGNGSSIDMDLSQVTEDYFTKEEVQQIVDQKITETMEWGSF